MTAPDADSAGPLSHLRVVDCTTGIAGAYCSKLLADAGADVVKVEPPTGDPLRSYTASGTPVDAEVGAPLFRYLAAGKRSILSTPGDLPGSGQVAGLLGGADVLLEGAAPVTVAVAGVRARHPHLVVASITPFGAGGPMSGWPATDFTMQAESGTVLFRGNADRPPVQIGGRLAQFLGGVYAAPAIVAACARARRTGVGEHIDVSITEAMAVAGSILGDTAHHVFGRPELLTPARSTETPSVERALDGFIGFNTNTPPQLEGFLVLIERPDLIGDDRFAGLGGRYLN